MKGPSFGRESTLQKSPKGKRIEHKKPRTNRLSLEMLEDRRLLSGVTGAHVDFGDESALISSQGEVSAPVLGSVSSAHASAVSHELHAAHDAALEAILDDVVGPSNAAKPAANVPSVAEGESQFIVSPGIRPDVNGDGCVSAIDALGDINEINVYGSGPVTQEFAAPYHDVNLDGYLSPVDVLIVINWLNTHGATCNSPITNNLTVMARGGKVSVPPPGLLNNVGGVAPLTAELVSPPAHGTISFLPDGSFDYDTNFGYSGPESFTYRIRSADGQVAIGKVDFTVTAPTQPPFPVADTYFVEPGQILDPVKGVLANDTDPDNFDLRARLTDPPQHGTLQFSQDGTFIYEPVGDFQGEDGFTYVAMNSGFPAGPIPVSISVAPNLGPAGPAMQTATVLEGGTISVDAGHGLLQGFTDREGDLPLTAQVVPPFTTDGTFAAAADGSWSFTPNQHFNNGVATVSYVALDANGHPSAPSQLQIIVTPNQAPTGLTDHAYQVAEGHTLNVPAAQGLLAGVENPEPGEAFHPVIIFPPLNATITLNPDGSFACTPVSDAQPGDQIAFTYAVLDAAGKQSVSKTVTITLTPNHVPTATNATTSVVEDQALTFDILPYVNDPDGDPLIVSTVTDTRHGFARIVGHTVEFYPDVDYVGPARFTFTASDGIAGSNPATVFINVTPAAAGEGEADPLAFVSAPDKKAYDAATDDVLTNGLPSADLLS